MRLERSPEAQIRKSLIMVIGIPILCIVLYAFSRRKTAICVERYGMDECRPHPARYAALAIAILTCLYGALRIKRVLMQYDAI